MQIEFTSTRVTNTDGSTDWKKQLVIDGVDITEHVRQRDFTITMDPRLGRPVVTCSFWPSSLTVEGDAGVLLNHILDQVGDEPLESRVEPEPER